MTTRATLRRPGPAAPLKRASAPAAAAHPPTSAGPGATSPLHASILAYPAELSHAEVYRRLTACGVEVSRALVSAVRRRAQGARTAGRPTTGAATHHTARGRLLLATLVTAAERHGVEPEDVVAAGDEAMANIATGEQI